MIQSVILGVIAATVTIAVGAAGVQTVRLKVKREELRLATIELEACGNRLNNLVEDVKSDAEIDKLTDDDLTSVPSHWLRPTTTD